MTRKIPKTARISPRKTKSLKEYLHSKSTPLENGCIDWIGCRTKEGYGNVHSTNWGRDYNASLPHQLAYIEAFGGYDRNYAVWKTCKLKNCLNPKHLYLKLKGY